MIDVVIVGQSIIACMALEKVISLFGVRTVVDHIVGNIVVTRPVINVDNGLAKKRHFSWIASSKLDNTTACFNSYLTKVEYNILSANCEPGGNNSLCAVTDCFLVSLAVVCLSELSSSLSSPWYNCNRGFVDSVS